MHRWIHRGADYEAPQASTAAVDSEKGVTISEPKSCTDPDAFFRDECSPSGTCSDTRAASRCPTAAPQSEQSLPLADSVSAAADCHSAGEGLQCSSQVPPLRCSSSAADQRSSASACSDDSRTGEAHSSACKARDRLEHAVPEAAAIRIHQLFGDASVLVGVHPDQVDLPFRPLVMQWGSKHMFSLALA